MGKPATTQEAPQAAPQSLGAAAIHEKVRKGTRVFADVPGAPRVTLSDGRIGAVQREQRADGTEGPMQVAILRPGTDDGSGTRFALADLQKLSDALGLQGVTLIAPYAPQQA